VLLLAEETQRVVRYGFFTTRFVRAATQAIASAEACRMVLDELARLGARNSPEQPVRVSAEETTSLSWHASLRQRGTGAGFTFFPDESN